jgi:hypothetical protein
MRALLFALLVTLGACQPDPAAPEVAPASAIPTYAGDLAPIDDGTAVPGFAALRDTLRAVVARRDTAALLDLVAADARLSFGDGAGGPEEFAQTWFEAPPGEPVWAVLDHVLENGSVEEDGAVVAPFVAGFWPDALDPYSTVVVAGSDVPAFDRPDGAEVARLSEIALPTTAPHDSGWRPVTLPDGTGAVVAADAALSPVGYRATFWDDGDGWRLRSLLAGD